MKLLNKHKDEQGFTLTSLMVSMVILGILFPLTLEPILVMARAQAKSVNLSKAELLANTYAASSRTNKELSEVPDTCDLTNQGNNVIQKPPLIRSSDKYALFSFMACQNGFEFKDIIVSNIRFKYFMG